MKPTRREMIKSTGLGLLTLRLFGAGCGSVLSSTTPEIPQLTPEMQVTQTILERFFKSTPEAYSATDNKCILAKHDMNSFLPEHNMEGIDRRVTTIAHDIGNFPIVTFDYQGAKVARVMYDRDRDWDGKPNHAFEFSYDDQGRMTQVKVFAALKFNEDLALDFFKGEPHAIIDINYGDQIVVTQTEVQGGWWPSHEGLIFTMTPISDQTVKAKFQSGRNEVIYTFDEKGRILTENRFLSGKPHDSSKFVYNHGGIIKFKTNSRRKLPEGRDAHEVIVWDLNWNKTGEKSYSNNGSYNPLESWQRASGKSGMTKGNVTKYEQAFYRKNKKGKQVQSGPARVIDFSYELPTKVTLSHSEEGQITFDVEKELVYKKAFR